jgi:two-component system, NarL family, sensor kinase
MPISRQRDAPEKEATVLSTIADILEKSLTETRTISYLLHPPLLDEVGFASAASWYVEGFAKRSRIRVNLNIPEGLKRLPGPLELVLFRILQESLTNIHRHADTSLADIQLYFEAEDVVLEVQHRGKGCIPSVLLDRFRSTGQGVGVGLNSMRERINDLGGRFEIRSNEKGTLVRAVIPLTTAFSKQASAENWSEK